MINLCESLYESTAHCRKLGGEQRSACYHEHDVVVTTDTSKCKPDHVICKISGSNAFLCRNASPTFSDVASGSSQFVNNVTMKASSSRLASPR